MLTCRFIHQSKQIMPLYRINWIISNQTWTFTERIEALAKKFYNCCCSYLFFFLFILSIKLCFQLWILNFFIFYRFILSQANNIIILIQFQWMKETLYRNAVDSAWNLKGIIDQWIWFVVVQSSVQLMSNVWWSSSKVPKLFKMTRISGIKARVVRYVNALSVSRSKHCAQQAKTWNALMAHPSDRNATYVPNHVVEDFDSLSQLLISA